MSLTLATATRINADAMYDTVTAGQLMGGINRRDVCLLIKNGTIRGYRRPPVRRARERKTSSTKTGQLVVPGLEIIRYNAAMEPVAAPSASRRQRKTTRVVLPEPY